MSNPQSLIVLLNDLMFQVKIADAAKQLGIQATFVKAPAPLLQMAKEQQPCLIILDVNFAEAEPLKVIQALKTESKTQTIPLLGFVSHVQTDLRAAAVQAGCDVVLARSAFVQNLPEQLRRCASSDAAI